MDPIKLIITLAVIASAIWVYFDMQKIGMEDENTKDALIGKRLAWRWAAGVLLLWLIFFPYYLIKRNEFMNNQAKSKKP
jgi:hypothetical protein